MYRSLILSTCCVLALGLAGSASASVVLVGGDTLNGNFNNLITPSTTDVQPFSNTVAWVNLNGNQDTQATRTNILYEGTRTAVLSTSASKVFGLDTGHVITPGESYDMSYVWRDASGWVDNRDEVRVALFVTEDNTIMGTRRNLVEDLSGLSTIDSSWEEVIRNNVYTATSADAGKTLFVAIDTTAPANSFARLDNFVLTVATPATIASGPNPNNDSEDVRPDAKLSWTPGASAVSHDVYFGTVFDDVNDASRTDPRDVLASQGQSDTIYVPAVRLDLSRTYYWRIDEVSAPPASTIFKGDVWSFTIEPIAYPISANSIIATASSSNKAEEEPANTINGSGLDTDDLHSPEATDMWLSNMTGAQPTWIQYEFDRVYKLHQMSVWNYNSSVEPAIGFGIKEAKLEYSTDGVNWTTLGTTYEFARGPGEAGYAANTTIDLGGVAATYVRITANSNWGGILPQYGLSEVRFFYIPVNAREPNPAPGVMDVSVDATLSWRTGREVAKHNVYLSTDQQAVIDGTTPVATVSQASYPASLDLANTYYWRIDEVNDVETPSAWQGDIWSFSTQEYLVVDDFESYNDIESGQEGSKLIYETWIDGFGTTTNGSTIGYTEAFQPSMESTVVYDGKQSVPLFYDNTMAAYSEVTANIAALQPGPNWSQHGIKALTLWFRGDPNNAAQQMYAKLNGVKVAYDGDAANASLTSWQMWYIDLASLGINLSNVTDLTIGFERLGGVGGKGVIYLDAIRLYSHDRQLITPVDPGTAGIQAYYQFEGNTNDGSVNKRNGMAQGEPVFAAGRLGQVMSFDGFNDYVTIDGYKGILANASGVQQPFTITVWVKTTSTADGTLVCWGSSTNGQRVDFRLGVGRLRVEHGNGNLQGNTVLADDQWHHVALTVAEGASISYPAVKLYLDGNDDSQKTADPDVFSIIASVDVTIGCRGTHNDRFYLGLIDEVRIYDRELTQAEIASLAGKTKPFDEPF